MTKDKMCPFRKEVIYESWENKIGGNSYGYLPTSYSENFLPCIGKECAAYWSDTIIKTGLTHPVEVDGCKLIFRG